MANIKIRRGWEIPEREVVAEEVFLNRREFIKKLGLGSIAAAGVFSGAEQALAFINSSTTQTSDKLYPAKRNAKYVLDRPLTEERFATGYNNFYEFTTDKPRVADLVGNFKTHPWTVEVTGMIAKPKTFDIKELSRLFPVEERLYRHRCVEAWAMAVPWTGFSLKALVDYVQPTSKAKFVRMVSFNKPDEAPGMKTQSWYPWPYYEGLTLAEATNELAFMVTGMYGHALPKQNGAPIRLAVPWKYGYKSIKSIVKIEFTDQQPKTFWNDIAPTEYSFLSNVNPKVPHPRWLQAHERMIIDGERRPTLPYNGYGEFVAHLYA